MLYSESKFLFVKIFHGHYQIDYSFAMLLCRITLNQPKALYLLFEFHLSQSMENQHVAGNSKPTIVSKTKIADPLTVVHDSTLDSTATPDIFQV